MRDIRDVKLAELMVGHSASVKQGDKVLVYGDAAAEPLIREIYLKSLEVGSFPVVVPMFREHQRLQLMHGTDEQIASFPDFMITIAETYDVIFFVYAEENTQALNQVPPEKVSAYFKGRQKFSQIMLGRAARGEMRWSLVHYPTHAYAQDAGMSLTEYADFLYQACMPDLDDPIGYWQGVSVRQDKIVDWLQGKKRIHVTAKETDLWLSVAGRTFINCDCRNNVPDGEVFTGPVEDSVEGHVYYSYPAIFRGREVTGVRLWFEKGKVVKATAEKNEAYLLKMLDADEGARRVGEFAIGTNDGIQQFTHQILFDEKIGGSFHMALGNGYPETGSVNKSAIHWDMICDLRDGGEIWVDDELLYQNGKFVIDF